MIVARRSYLPALVAMTFTILVYETAAVAQPLVTGDLTIYYDFDSFTNTVMDGSGNGFNGKVQDGTRNVLDGDTGREDLHTTGVISNDTSNPRRGAGAIRFTQTDQTWQDPNAADPTAVVLQDPVFVDMDGGHIKATHPELLPQTAVTYAAWVNIEPINATNGWNSPASIVQGSTAGPGHGNPHFHAEGAGNIRLTLRDEFGSNVVDSKSGFSDHPFPNQPDIDGSGAAPQPWPTNTWFHLAGTYDETTNDWAVYYNGVKIRGGVPVGVGPLGQWDKREFDARANFYDGLGLGAVYDSGGRRLHGMMDELYIFHRALSEAEIRTLAMLPPPEPFVSWLSNVSGSWNTDGNWTPASHPNSNITVATIGSVVTSPQTLFLNANSKIKGLVLSAPATVTIQGTAQLSMESNSGNATIAVNQGSHEVSVQLNTNTNTDVTTAGGATLDVHGVLNLNGKTLNISGGGTVNLNNAVVGGGAVINSATLGTEGATSLAGMLSSTGSLAIDVGGATANSFDSWAVTGAATLSGTLYVDAVNGFIPSHGQTFTVLTASSVSAASLTLGGPDASLFELIKNPTSLVLRVGPDGDYNRNGVVDAADYVIWREQLGTLVPQGTGADGTNNGEVTPFDYLFWKERFGHGKIPGNAAGALSAEVGESAVNVPEPASILLCVVGGLVIAFSQLQRRLNDKLKIVTSSSSSSSSCRLSCSGICRL